MQEPASACFASGLSKALLRLVCTVIQVRRKCRGWVLLTGLRDQLVASSPPQALPIDVLNGMSCGQCKYISLSHCSASSGTGSNQ